MLVSTQHKLIFVHNPKTAGKSLEAALKPYDDPKILRNRITKHEVLQDLIDKGQDGFYNGYTAIMLVRNPWDRFSSFFHYLWSYYPMKLNGTRSVKELAHHLKEQPEWLMKLHTITPQKDYVALRDPSNITIDIGRFENLHQDIERLLAPHGIKIAEMPHKNRSKNSDYRSEYDEETKQIIADFYAADIEEYKYEF